MSRERHTVALIGTGNVASHLGVRLHQQGINVAKIIGRNLESATRLADMVDAEACDLTSFEQHNDDFPTILAVSDDAIAPISARLNHRFLIHTSGSVPLSALASGRQAVLYPLQTFTAGRTVQWNDLPMCIEASGGAELEHVELLARKLSNAVYLINSEQRGVLHLAAVVMNNFVNHLYGLSAGYLEKQALTFEVLRPLMRETALKAMEISPEHAQTGPARRNDQSTVDRHIGMLEAHPELREVYQLLTQQITRKYHG